MTARKTTTKKPATQQKKKQTGTGISTDNVQKSPSVRRRVVRGEEGRKLSMKYDQQADARRARFAPRFYLKATPGENQAIIVFLDTVPGYAHDHEQWDKDNNRPVNIICAREVRPCPADLSGNYPAWSAFLTIIDTRSYQRRDGGIVKNQKRLMPFRGKIARGRLELLLRAHKNLTGCVFRVTRLSKTDSKIGSNFDLIKRLTSAQMKKLSADIAPYDYDEILAVPEDDSEYEAAGFHATVVGSQTDMTHGFDDNENTPDNNADLFEQNETGPGSARGVDIDSLL